MKLVIEAELHAAIKSFISNLIELPMGIFRRTAGGMHRVYWFLDRQKPSVEPNYDFDMERFGITIKGQLIWGFDSGCS